MPEQGSAGSTTDLWPVYVMLRGRVTYPKLVWAGGECRTRLAAAGVIPGLCAWLVQAAGSWGRREVLGDPWREVSWSGDVLLTRQWADGKNETNGMEWRMEWTIRGAAGISMGFPYWMHGVFTFNADKQDQISEASWTGPSGFNSLDMSNFWCSSLSCGRCDH